jgi:3-oxoacyl-[acyl-carrier-protein] synthase II
MDSGRIFISGIGAVSCLGLSVDEMWEGILSGRSGIGEIKAFDASEFPCRLGGECPEFKISKHVPKFHRKSRKLMSRDIELAIVAANEAVASSGLVSRAIDSENVNFEPTRAAINVGAGLISCDLEEIAPAVASCVTDGKFDISKWGKVGMELLTPIWLLKYLPNMPACHIGIIHDIQGPSNSITCGEAGGLIAVSEAASVLRRGCADVAVAGGCEGKVNPIVMLRQCLIGRANRESNDRPGEACRPFDAGAKGSIFGEGAGMVVLETEEHIAKRGGGKVLAEFAGAGSASDAGSDYRHLEDSGEGMLNAITKALDDAEIDGGDVDLVVPHGTGIACDDAVEAKAISDALGDAVKDAAVLPIKSMVSNTGAASGAIDLIAAVKAMEGSEVPAAKNFEKAAEGCELNIVKDKIEKEIRYALVVSYTFGKQAAAMVIKQANSS